MMNPPTGIARTLATLLSAGGKVPVQDAILLVRALASQVAELHSRGQVHRGITPASVALEGDSTPALSDIAARPAESPADVRQYLPPELGQLLPGELPVEMVENGEKGTGPLLTRSPTRCQRGSKPQAA